jgi:hypothetical protein
MMRVWFSYSPFVPSYYGIKISSTLQFCTRDRQHEAVSVFCLKELKVQSSIDNWLPNIDRTVCHSEGSAIGCECLKAAGKCSQWRQVGTPIGTHRRTKDGTCSDNVTWKLLSNNSGNRCKIGR